MPTIDNFSLRVDGQPTPRVTLRLDFKSGFPKGEKQIVLNDPTLGPIALTEDFLLELEESGVWHRVSLRYLTTLLWSYKAVA